MSTALVWICWGLVAAGIAAVVAAVRSLSGHVRPLRRALRRLRWRQADLDRLRVRAEQTQELIAALAEQAQAVADARASAGTDRPG